jgi:hypothetical protein
VCTGRPGPHKDLTIFQRSEKRLIVVDDSNSALSTNPRNTVQVPRWCGSPYDQALIEWFPQILEKCTAADRRVIIRDARGSTKMLGKMCQLRPMTRRSWAENNLTLQLIGG